MFAIYKRELAAYFHSFIGFLFVGASLFFLGLYFTVYQLMAGYPYIAYTVSGVIFVFLLSVPILSMRILAEERRNRTDQLILTAPVTVGQVVLGKYLAMETILAVPTLIFCFYPLIMTAYGTVPLGEGYLAILAYFLFGSTAIALGMLVSSLTESQVIAAVLGFGLLFLGYMMSSICSLISATGNLLTRILSCFDLYSPFAAMLNGTLDVSAVVYFLSVAGFALFLTTQSIQKRRYSVSVKTLGFGAYSVGTVALAAAVTVAVNLVVRAMPVSWTSLDLTYEKLYSLTDQTKEFVDKMTEDVTIYVLVKESDEDAVLGQTLDRYQDLSDHIRVEYVDPTVNPRFHTQYTTGSVTMNSLIVVSSLRSTVVDMGDIYEESFDYSTYTSDITGYDGEGQITSALAYVTSTDLPKAYLTQGHGEQTLSADFEEALSKENVERGTVNLMDQDQVPEDASCLIVNGPATDFSSDDADKVIDYLEQGGKVILVTQYTQEPLENVNRILDYMGLSLAPGMVMEQDASCYYQVPFYLLPKVGYSAYTAGIYGEYYVFAPYAQGFTVTDPDREDIAYDSFLTTSDSAFARQDLENTEDLTKKEGDAQGPFVLGVEAVKTLENGEESVLVAYSCSQMFTDAASQMVSGANQVLFTNTVSSFADHETSVSVPVKSYEVSTLMVPASSKRLLGILVTGVLPLGCLAAGLVIWLRRRRR